MTAGANLPSYKYNDAIKEAYGYGTYSAPMYLYQGHGSLYSVNCLFVQKQGASQREQGCSKGADRFKQQHLLSTGACQGMYSGDATTIPGHVL